MASEMTTFIMKSLDVYLLIFSRILGFVATVPFFSRNNIPAPLKVGLSMMISYIILPFVVGDVAFGSTGEFLFLVARELLIGFFMGLSATLVFNVFVSAGAHADVQIGLSMAQMVDPSSGNKNTLTGVLFTVFSYLLLLAADIHHLLIKALVNSFEIAPLGNFTIYSENFLTYTTKLMSYFMFASVLIIIPIMITLFLGNILLAFMAKVMPQMNVFIVGMPFKIIVGLAIIYFTIGFIKGLFIDVFKQMLEFLYMFLRIV